jgi:hypothetical protein
MEYTRQTMALEINLIGSKADNAFACRAEKLLLHRHPGANCSSPMTKSP